MEATSKIYSLNLLDTRTHLFAVLFVVGNLALPQFCHLMPQGGLIFLPIYFFTLVGAYKYGFSVGVLTAVLSPIVNSAIFGMPVAAMVLPIIAKSILLAAAAAFVAHRMQRVTILALVAVVLSYQIVGSLAEWALSSNFMVAAQDFRLGIPGMLLQIFGGYAVIRYLIKK